MHIRVLVGTALILTIIGLWVNWSNQPPSAPSSLLLPQLDIDASVASDFEGLAKETWGDFLDKFQARSDCFGNVRLIASYDLDSKAVYNPEQATVTVRVPGSPAQLKSALVHEWAHHIEFQCAELEELQLAFREVLEIHPDTPWHSSNTLNDISMRAWKEIPSEQFAETTVVFVLGRGHIPSQIRVNNAAVHVIAEWAAGGKSMVSTMEKARGE